MRNKLIVISHVFIDPDKLNTVNRGLNEILKYYLNYFNEVEFIGPSNVELTHELNKKDNIYYSSITTYGKSTNKKIFHILKYPLFKKRLLALLLNDNNCVIQLRIPSIFSMSAYYVVRKLNVPITTYIAGDWETTFPANYSFTGNKILSQLLDKSQSNIIRKSIAVSAGDYLAGKYSNISKVHPYYSTTHNQVTHRKNNYPPRKLLIVGRFERGKRIEDVISAMHILREKKYDFILNVVGNGDRYDDIKKEIISKKIENRIFLKGYISNSEEMRNIYLDSDILIHPSISEGTPKVIPEAMSCGVIPIAVRDVGSNNYIIKDGKNGFLISPYSAREIADRIEMIYNNQSLYKSLINNAYEYAKEHTIQKEMDKMWQFVFEELEQRL